MPPPLVGGLARGGMIRSAAKRAAVGSPKDEINMPKEVQACIERAEKILHDWKSWSKEVLVHQKDKTFYK
eukprot:12246536-Prorocentrum_lima.AAC.1